MMNIRALRTSLSMRVKARNVTARRPVMVPKNDRKPTTTQRSAMAGRTLGFGLPVSGQYIYRFQCSLLSLTSAAARTVRLRITGPVSRDSSCRGPARSFRFRAAYRISGSVFHFEVATISTLDLHHFLRRRRIDSRHGGCPAGGGESLLHVCIQSVGRHSRPAPHGASASAHGGGHERAAEHRPSQPDQGETESPNREGEIPASGTDQPGHVAAR